MTQEELKQRLKELILEAPKTNIVYGDIKLKEPIQTAQTIVNNLIANGVTIRHHAEWIGTSGVKGIYDDFYCSFCKKFTKERNPNSLGDFCSFCGSDMRSEETHGEVIPDKMVELRQNIKFETGDNAKIVGNVSEHEFEIGTIVRLEKFDTDYKAFVGEEFWWVVDDELEPIEDADMRG